MLNALVLLPRVLHILALDQNLGLGLDGGVECRSRRVASRAAILALASHPPVLADAPAPALLALASPPPVLADAPAPALLALASLPPVLADAPAPALLALASLPPVLADAPAPALLAQMRTPCTLRCLPCSQMLPHAPLPCSQMLLALLALAIARSPSRARRCSRPRTPCTCFAASRARRCSRPRTPCTGFAASRARRCPSPRTPCTGFAASRARRSESPRTPCTRFAASRARRSLSPGTPCSSTPPASCRARTSCHSSAPRPSADASRGPGPWRHAQWAVTHAPAAALPETPRLFRAFRTPKRRHCLRYISSNADVESVYDRDTCPARRHFASRVPVLFATFAFTPPPPSLLPSS